MNYEYFNKTVPNLENLPQRLMKFCKNYSDFEKYFKIYGRNSELWLQKIHENFHYGIFSPTKKGNYLETFPFYRFWLDMYCRCYEEALWNSIVAQGGKRAEREADEAVEKFRKEMQ